MLYAAIATYNDAVSRGLKETVDSVSKFVDRVDIFDGSWKGQPSTKENLKYIEDELDLKLVPPQEGWKEEYDKRMFMQRYHGDEAWMFYLDSDEVLLGGGSNLKFFVAHADLDVPGDVFNVIIYGEKDKNIGFMPRLMRREQYGRPRNVDAKPIPVAIRHKCMGRNTIA